MRPEFLTVGIVFDDFAHVHVRQQKRARVGEPRMTELAVYGLRILDRNHELTLVLAGDDIHDHNLGGIAVLHVEDAVLADRPRGVHLGALRSVVVPEHLFVPVDQRDAELVREEHVAIGKQHGIADFALRRAIVKLPGDLSFSHDVHILRLGLSGVEEIMLR